MNILLTIALVLFALWLLGWLGNIVIGLFFFVLAWLVDVWDRVFPPGPPDDPNSKSL